MSNTNDMVSGWLNDAGLDSPAGPLFSSSQFAEADIVSESIRPTTLGGCGTACTGSQTRQCC